MGWVGGYHRFIFSSPTPSLCLIGEGSKILSFKGVVGDGDEPFWAKTWSDGPKIGRNKQKWQKDTIFRIVDYLIIFPKKIKMVMKSKYNLLFGVFTNLSK